MRPLNQAPVLLAFALVGASCGDPSVDRPKTLGIFEIDGGVAPPPPPPQVESLPRLQPYRILTLRGRSSGRRVYIEGAGNRRQVAVRPDGRFCMDLPLSGTGEYELYASTQAADGQVSEPAGPFRVTYDGSAPPIEGAVTCTGADPAGCKEAFEICGNGRDDDCNSLVDEADPRCAPCTDDILEENDSPGSPRLEPGARYTNLEICPRDPDWYGVVLEEGETVSAAIRFDHAEGDLELQLLAPNETRVLVESRTLMNEEMVSYTATAGGTFHLHVFGTDITSNRYDLDLDVRGR